jgi:hypothetical protein
MTPAPTEREARTVTPYERLRWRYGVPEALLNDFMAQVRAEYPAAAPSDTPINQCDGCARGLPVDGSGNHYVIDKADPMRHVLVIGCTKDRYAAVSLPAPHSGTPEKPKHSTVFATDTEILDD